MALLKLSQVLVSSVIPFLTISVVGRTFDCQIPHSCPPEKRFCTAAGCVSKCPDNSFENGSVCVLNCGDWVISNNSCREVCPPSNSIIYEQVTVFAGSFKTVRRCVSVCRDFDQELIEYNGTCVHQCPSDANLILENVCIDKCPEMYSFLREYDRYGIQVSECMAKCPSTLPFDDGVNRTCVSKCPENRKFVLNSTCVANCTDNMPYFINVSGALHCYNQCPSGTFAKNFTCMKKCPNVLYSGKCVSVCPPSTVRKNNICYDPCTFGTRLNDTECHCDLRDAGICVEKCPAYRSYNENSDCVEKCSDGKLGYDFICTDMANCNRSIIFDRQCLHSCPLGMYWADYKIDVNNSSKSCYSESDLILRLKITLPLLFLWIICVILALNVYRLRRCCVNIGMMKRKYETSVSETELHQSRPPTPEHNGTATSSV